MTATERSLKRLTTALRRLDHCTVDLLAARMIANNGGEKHLAIGIDAINHDASKAYDSLRSLVDLLKSRIEAGGAA